MTMTARICALALVAAGALSAAGGSATARAVPPDLGSTQWVESWASAQQTPEPQNALPASALQDATLREIVHLSAGGTRLRVRLSNAFGVAPLHIAAAHVARPILLASGEIDGSTDRALTFSGKGEVTIPAGADYLSDPIDFPAAPLSDLAVSLYVEASPARQTSHPGSRETSFLAHGDQVSRATLPAATRVDHWYFLSGIEVAAAPEAATIVALGDSITDGHGSTTNGNDRWPDDLARRLAAASGDTLGIPASLRGAGASMPGLHAAPLGVVNAGIGGNRLLADGIGPNALARFNRDVLAQAAVRDVIVLEGINDLGVATAGHALSPQAHRALVEHITAAYAQLIARAHAHGIRVLGGTLTPDAGSAIYHPDAAAEADRQAVNRWIRTPGHFDAVVDFDAALRDPVHPDHMLRAYDSGDHLHPSPAGYRAMADAIPLELFEERPTDPAALLTFTPFHANGIYRLGEKAGWTVSVRAGSRPPPGAYTYTVRENDDAVVTQGTLEPTSGAARIEVSLDHPAMLYVTVEWQPTEAPYRGERIATLGAAIDPTGLKPTTPRPADFDAFWRAKLAALKRIPIHPVLVRIPTQQAGVELYRVRLDSLGSHVQGYLAMPAHAGPLQGAAAGPLQGGAGPLRGASVGSCRDAAAGAPPSAATCPPGGASAGRFPALVIYQYAGVYALNPKTATDRAAEGWLAFDVDSHDLPPDQGTGVPSDYDTIGNTDRNTSYFLYMYLRDTRVIDYIETSPHWDHRTIVLTGTSMGGQQSLATAGLNPGRITAVVVNEPSGADSSGALHGRYVGYPWWHQTDPRVLDAARYFDTVNFASRIEAPALVAMGFIDTIAPPAGIWTALNQIPAPKEAVPMVESDHNNITPQKQDAYLQRSEQVLAMLLVGRSFHPDQSLTRPRD